MLMGNIRTSFVKRLAKELIETHKGVFTTDFEENKKLVQEYSTVSTKHLRNKLFFLFNLFFNVLFFNRLSNYLYNIDYTFLKFSLIF